MTITNKQKKLINDCFNAIPLVHIQFSDMQTNLYKMQLADEKEHRRGRPSSALPVSLAAKYFTVKHLLDGCLSIGRYKITDILHIRLVCLYSQAYAIEYEKELASFVSFMAQHPEFNSLDYFDMVKGN